MEYGDEHGAQAAYKKSTPYNSAEKDTIMTQSNSPFTPTSPQNNFNSQNNGEVPPQSYPAQQPYGAPHQTQQPYNQISPQYVVPQQPYQAASNYAQNPSQPVYSQPVYPQAAYTQPAGQYGEQNSWNGMAIAGFICSFFINIIGLILSIIGYNQVKKTGEKGKELALAGIIISAASLIISVLIFIFVVVIGVSVVNSVEERYSDYYSQYDPSYEYNRMQDGLQVSYIDRESQEFLLQGLTVQA